MKEITGFWFIDGNPSMDDFVFRKDGKGFYEFYNWGFCYYTEFDWSINPDGTLKIAYGKTVFNPSDGEIKDTSKPFTHESLSWSIVGKELTIDFPLDETHQAPYHMSNTYEKSRKPVPDDYVPTFKD